MILPTIDPITLLPALSKVFTQIIIIVDRRNNWIDNSNIMSEVQAGFRKGYCITTTNNNYICS